MRPPAIEKMGYYPTDEPVLDILKTYIHPSEEGRGRLLDPCTGEGIAASALGQALNCETWGAELSPVRAELAAKVMDKVYPTAWQMCQLTDEAITLLFLNPPYEYDQHDSHKRMELEFIKSTTNKLIRGGLLVYIIPQHILALQEIARMLVGHYEALSVYRFPDGLFEKFKQIIVLAYRRKAYKTPTEKEMSNFLELAKSEIEPIPALEEPTYQLFPAPERNPSGKPILFKRMDWEPEEIAEASVSQGARTTKEWLDLINPKRGLAELTRPVMPLKKGHIAMLMASGMMGTVHLKDEVGKPILVKGRVVKVVEKTEEEDAHDKNVVVEKYKDRFVTTVSVLKQESIEVIQDVKGLSEFMKAHGDKIANHVLQTYRPLYNFDPTPKEIAILDRLGRNREALPGQMEAGLLATQRHAAAAMARAIRVHGVGNLQGEMGIGKSIIGAAVIELLDAYPGLIICPPHLVPKWIREIEETTPGSHAIELRRIGRNSDDPKDVNDVKTFLEGYEEAARNNNRHKPKWVAVVANTAAKMGAAWQPAVTWKTTIHPLTGKRVKACACPSCGGIAMQEQQGILVPVMDIKDLADTRQFCTYQVPGWQLDPNGRIHRDEQGEPVWGKHICHTPLFEFTGNRRQAIAEYISKHKKGTFQLLIGDEVHQFKSKSSDRGVSFHQLVMACKQTLTLTGTFFGGKSTSIFWLLHRLNHGVRRDFGFNDETRWARLYGVLETTQRRHRGDDDEEDGVFTGNRRYRNQAKEQPGVSPAIINRLLDTTVFLSLKDLGLALPPYSEEVVVLEMEDEHKTQYQAMDNTLRQMAIQSNRYLSMWLQWSLARPNSAFRDEVVMIDKVEKDGEDYPKGTLLGITCGGFRKSMATQRGLVVGLLSSGETSGT